jgi:hypothetical protein
MNETELIARLESLEQGAAQLRAQNASLVGYCVALETAMIWSVLAQAGKQGATKDHFRKALNMLRLSIPDDQLRAGASAVTLEVLERVFSRLSTAAADDPE